MAARILSLRPGSQRRILAGKHRFRSPDSGLPVIPLPEPEPLFSVVIRGGGEDRVIATCVDWDEAELIAAKWNFEFGFPRLVWAWIEPAAEIGKAVAA